MTILIPGEKPIYKGNEIHVTISPKEKEKCIPKICFCEKGELLKNGGFETPSFSPSEVFASWIVQSRTLDIELVKDTENVYQGRAAASVRTSSPSGPFPSILVLRQYVNVTPGCLYKLKFAERLVTPGQTDSIVHLLIARLVYLDGRQNEYELLNIPIQKTAVDEKYNLHEQIADLPVPCDVPGIIVQFSFYIIDTPDSVWNLDAVSLQAVSRISACC
ncbi:MAG: hypothetical protein ACOX8A_05445 [Thermacetogeniaceae bacterium]|jgi:hypothetical protein